ncbi:MAG: hypothetical protein QOE96_2289 [Blastocatellia bacterium]|jgi:uncharacterized BrkB/YihY/UPF0761 family membrane protein|nr:hypothetical protein [Blastocatellia bacterium]
MLFLQGAPDYGFHLLALVMGWTVTILVGAFALAIIYKMLKGDINLMYLIAGADGDASLSRFQFLIFTFVIALGLFLIILSQSPVPAFPATIPGGILALLGISGGSYVTSKAVDANASKPTVVVPPTVVQPSGQQTTVVMPQSE